MTMNKSLYWKRRALKYKTIIDENADDEARKYHKGNFMVRLHSTRSVWTLFFGPINYDFGISPAKVSKCVNFNLILNNLLAYVYFLAEIV